jgi:hypothetical protein
MICQLCGQEKALVDAHIIPRQLYKLENQDLKIYSIHEYSKKSRTGIYDGKKILCGDCDNKILGVFDNYGQTLLLKPFTEGNFLSEDGKNFFYKLDNIDYPKFKLFFISVLWRASITKHDFFCQVNLGSWEPVLRDMILNVDPGTKDDFSVILTKYQGALATIMPTPRRIRMKGINYYQFKIADYSVLIKVDKRPFPEELNPVILQPNQSLLIPIENYENSQEFSTILENIDKLIK